MEGVELSAAPSQTSCARRVSSPARCAKLRAALAVSTSNRKGPSNSGDRPRSCSSVANRQHFGVVLDAIQLRETFGEQP